jgi:hypothetical protein
MAQTQAPHASRAVVQHLPITLKKMNSDKTEHIKFRLIDSINDDVQGLYELDWAVKNYYNLKKSN